MLGVKERPARLETPPPTEAIEIKENAHDIT